MDNPTAQTTQHDYKLQSLNDGSTISARRKEREDKMTRGHRELSSTLQSEDYHQGRREQDANGGSVVEFSSGDLQDVCDSLEDEIPPTSIIVVGDDDEQIDKYCDCQQTPRNDTTSIELACTVDDACIYSSDGTSADGDAKQGDYSLTLEKQGVDGEIESFGQTIQIEQCFTYPPELYNGSKICFSTIQDGLGINSQCQITVGNDTPQNKCLYCRFCTSRRLTFNCTNIGYEDKSNCVDNNVNGSLLQFLYEPELDFALCPTTAPTTFPTFISMSGSADVDSNNGNNDKSQAVGRDTYHHSSVHIIFSAVTIILYMVR